MQFRLDYRKRLFYVGVVSVGRIDRAVDRGLHPDLAINQLHQKVLKFVTMVYLELRHALVYALQFLLMLRLDGVGGDFAADPVLDLGQKGTEHEENDGSTYPPWAYLF